MLFMVLENRLNLGTFRIQGGAKDEDYLLSTTLLRDCKLYQ